jgi:glycerate 2-kinase
LTAFTPPPRFADHLNHLAALRAAALRAVDPAAAVRRSLTPADFADAERVFIVGAGKAGVAMAEAAAEILGKRLASGVVAVPGRPAAAPNGITFVEGGHPAPTAGSLAAGRLVSDLLSQTTSRDLVIALISGGGSATLELPRAGLRLEDLQATTAALLKCGATINEINVIRSQLSQLKGGGLARLAAPARVLSLILSDVVGNPLDVIASGPTVISAASKEEALGVVEKYGLRSVIPNVVLEHLTKDEGRTTKSDFRPSSFVVRRNVENRLIASNRLAAEAAVAEAQVLGFHATFLADDWQGEARQVGKRLAEVVSSKDKDEGRTTNDEGKDIRPSSFVLRPSSSFVVRPSSFILGGESTVTVRGSGKGGRNQEVALAAAIEIAGLPNLVIATFATDGVDGPTDAAGAVVTGDTLARAQALGLDPQKYLDENDTYTFFSALGDLTITGPTGTNVNDLMFGLVYSEG